MKKPLLSVVIPVHNEEKDLKECLKTLSQQSYKNIEIIIVDDGSTDKTLEISREYKTKILKQNHQGPGKARNLGAGKSKGEILIFIDADMSFPKDFLEKLVKPIIEDKTGEIIGTTRETEIVKNTGNIWSRCWGRVRVDKESAEKARAFRAIKKREFIKMGRFDSRYGYADDQTFWFKYKVKPAVALGCLCYHKNPETLKSVYRQSRWIGASIENVFLNTPVVKYLAPFFMAVISPIAIIFLSIKKCHKNQDFKIFPYMLVFMAARYFGTIEGIINKTYLEKNVR